MSPTTRVLAVLMLAVTIAASTAASAVVRAAVLSSLGVPDGDRLLNIEPLRDLPGRGPVVFNESYPNYLRLRDSHFDAFSAMTCVIQSVISWDDRGDIRPLQASRVGQLLRHRGRAVRHWSAVPAVRAALIDVTRGLRN